MQPAARLTAARLDPRRACILVGIPCVFCPRVQQAGRFLPCPTPDHWQLRNQARRRHSSPWSPICGASLGFQRLKGDPDGREARANLMKPNTEGCWLFDVNYLFLDAELFVTVFASSQKIAQKSHRCFSGCTWLAVLMTASHPQTENGLCVWWCPGWSLGKSDG